MLIIHPSHDKGGLATGEGPGRVPQWGRVRRRARRSGSGTKRLWPEPPTDEEIDAVVRPVQWLLTQAGGDGLQLTQDGYLKPAVVRQTVSELGWDYRWPGAANRESQTLPVLVLRRQLQTWKLLRKTKGRLVLSPGTQDG